MFGSRLYICLPAAKLRVFYLTIAGLCYAFYLIILLLVEVIVKHSMIIIVVILLEKIIMSLMEVWLNLKSLLRNMRVVGIQDQNS